MAWLKVSGGPVLSLALPHHNPADTFSLCLGRLCSGGLPWEQGLWLEVLRFTGPTNTITTSQGERMAGCGEWAVLLPAGMINISAGPGGGVRAPMPASLNKNPGAGNGTEAR